MFTKPVMKANLEFQADGQAMHISAEAGVTDTIQLCDRALTIWFVPGNIRSQEPQGHNIRQLSGIHSWDSNNATQPTA